MRLIYAFALAALSASVNGERPEPSCITTEQTYKPYAHVGLEDACEALADKEFSTSGGGGNRAYYAKTLDVYMEGTDIKHRKCYIYEISLQGEGKQLSNMKCQGLFKGGIKECQSGFDFAAGPWSVE